MGRTGHRRYRRNRAIRLAMPDGDRCGICGHGGVLRRPEVDHTVAWLNGGSDDVDNLEPAHSGLNPCPTCGGTCNQTKKAQTVKATYRSRPW